MTKIVKGDSGPLGDKRRMPDELRLKKLEPVTLDCAGRGLGLPPKDSPCFLTFQVARAINGLDFPFIKEIGKCGKLDLGTFFPLPPKVVISSNPIKEKECDEAIMDEFLTSDEISQLLMHEKAGTIETLETLERKLLAFANVQDLTAKVKLFIIEMIYPLAAAEMQQNLKKIIQACEAMCSSVCFKDMLAVMLQIFHYLTSYGDVSSETRDSKKGFHLMKLESFEDFRLSKTHSFRGIVCFFLQNVRASQESREEHTVIIDRSNGGDLGCVWNETGKILSLSTKGLIPQWNVEVTMPYYEGGGKPIRINDKIIAVNENEDTTSFSEELAKEQVLTIVVAHEKLSFVEQLFVDLQPCQEVVQKEMKVEDTLARLEELKEFGNIVEKLAANERSLFEPSFEFGDPARLASLEAWSNGRASLVNLKAGIASAVKDAESMFEDLTTAALELKQFAALSKEDFDKYDIADIFNMVLKFAERLKFSWDELKKDPVEYRELRNTILTTASLKVIWGSSEDCLENAFNLWKLKEAAHDGNARVWNEEGKSTTIQKLFNLFDADGGGQLDWSEFQVTLQGLGFQKCEEDYVMRFIKAFDTDGDGLINMDEFSVMLTEQINFVFNLFVSDPNEFPEPMIRADDLLRVAEKLGKILAIEDAERMVTFLDSGDAQISSQEFEQLILMPPDDTMGGQQNTNIKLSRKRTKTSALSQPRSIHRAGTQHAFSTLFDEVMSPVRGRTSHIEFQFSNSGSRASSSTRVSLSPVNSPRNDAS